MRQTYASRCTKVGGSEAVILPRDIKKQLQIGAGDLMLMVRFGPVLIMRRATPGLVIDRDQIPTDAIPGAASPVSSNG